MIDLILHLFIDRICHYAITKSNIFNFYLFILFLFLQISPQLQSELQPTLSGPHIAHKLVELAIQHFDLASTTITGIPMKVCVPKSINISPLWPHFFTFILINRPHCLLINFNLIIYHKCHPSFISATVMKRIHH